MTELFGQFLKDRHLRAGPATTDAYDQSKQFEVRMPIREEQFLKPLDRRASFKMELTPLGGELRAVDGERVRIGLPGKFTEQITLSLPANWRVTVPAQTDEKTSFAQYFSRAVVQNGVLRITREMEISEGVVGQSSQRTRRRSGESFSKTGNKR